MLEIPKRVFIEKIDPEIDEGRFPARRAVGEGVVVQADIFADGHDLLAARLLFRKQGEERWQSLLMTPLVNDRWSALFEVPEIGGYEFTIQAWIDRYGTWADKVAKNHAAGLDIGLDLLEGAALLRQAAQRSDEAAAGRLAGVADLLQEPGAAGGRLEMALDPDLTGLMAHLEDPASLVSYGRVLRVTVERPLARFSTWYEMFPRSCAAEPGHHGTFQDCIARLPYIASMGFDVLYLPPIHPIGSTNRKGRNNQAQTGPDDPGSPWAIGSEAGGHTAVHPALGDLEAFRKLVGAARDHGIETAIDLAFQASPDHPYVRGHPEWFRKRPDGTIQYAENPPKKYEDIFPFDFESGQAEALWRELLEVARFWMRQGIRIFRVDNPHTKPLAFWDWLIAECKKEHPETIFLSEAFTRPKKMYRLAKGGFTQSYTYFTWRNLKWEIEQYFKELSRPPLRDFFWPNLWPNTPDILPEFLQTGGRAAFVIRLVLAATLSSNYGIYGPPFELLVNEPREPFSEEYSDSEKYEILHWNLDQAHSLKPVITRVNRIRRENPALQRNAGLRFHPVDNESLICYSKSTDDMSNIIVTLVNLDPRRTHSGWVDLPLELLEIGERQPFQVHDLLSGARYLWHSGINYVELDPGSMPAHIFRIRRRVRSERDFDYFM